MIDVSDIFEELLKPELGGFSRELAQHVLSVSFPQEKITRYQELADRVQMGALTPDERAELDAFVQADAILSILKGKARRSLIQHAPAV